MPRYPALEALSELPDTNATVSSFELTRVEKNSHPPFESDEPEMSLLEEEDSLEFSDDELLPFMDDDDSEKFLEKVYRNAKRTPARRKSVSKLLSVNDDELKNDPDAGKFTNPALNELHERGLITELLYELKSGKEATVYVAEGNEGLIAVKLYVDSRVRSFKNDALYREGRFIADGRMKKAIDQRSDTGVSAQNFLWVGEEFAQLHALYAAGVRSPKPLAHEGGVILMEFIGNEEGAAPRVSDARLTKEEAEVAFNQSLEQYARILSIGRVHGDYSTFNLLWWQGECVVIDFPQVVKVKENPSANGILERDIQGLCRTFRTFGIKKDWVAALQIIKAKARALQTEMLPEEMENIL
jgi:RIO kinase 1